MYFNEFTKSLKQANIVESVRLYLQLVELTEEGKILVNGVESDFKTIEEAKQYIKQDYTSYQLSEQISKDSYEELSENTVAKIIKEYHDVKVTDTLIESYIQLASSNIFTVDPVVQDIRKLNKLDVVVEGKIHYELSDGSVVAINEATQELLNNLLQNQKEIIEYMREGKDNFLHVLERIEG